MRSVAFSGVHARRRWLFVVAMFLAGLVAAGCSAPHGPLQPTTEIGFIQVSHDITLRRLLVRSPSPKGVVVLLHGFPETLFAWREVASRLGVEHDVHAFDWPGYGLSSRPPADRFSYAPRDYARVLRDYIAASGIDKSRLVIYATDIGALPALLLALDDPQVARSIIVGDFAPFDRPQYMYPSLQSLKSKPSADATRASMNQSRDDILENAFRRGLSTDEPFNVSREFRDDMYRGWNQNGITSADAFYHYYAHFTRDQNHLESNLSRLRTHIKVVWGEKDIYIQPEMGAEFSRRANAELTVLPGLGHYPHLQSPAQTIRELRSVGP